jgi:hypothetical protein
VFPSSSSFFEKMFSENNFEYFLYFELFINVLFWKEKTKGKKKKKNYQRKLPYRSPSSHQFKTFALNLKILRYIGISDRTKIFYKLICKKQNHVSIIM